MFAGRTHNFNQIYMCIPEISIKYNKSRCDTIKVLRVCEFLGNGTLGSAMFPDIRAPFPWRRRAERRRRKVHRCCLQDAHRTNDKIYFQLFNGQGRGGRSHHQLGTSKGETRTSHPPTKRGGRPHRILVSHLPDAAMAPFAVFSPETEERRQQSIPPGRISRNSLLIAQSFVRAGHFDLVFEVCCGRPREGYVGRAFHASALFTQPSAGKSAM